MPTDMLIYEMLTDRFQLVCVSKLSDAYFKREAYKGRTRISCGTGWWTKKFETTLSSQVKFELTITLRRSASFDPQTSGAY